MTLKTLRHSDNVYYRQQYLNTIFIRFDYNTRRVICI